MLAVAGVERPEPDDDVGALAPVLALPHRRDGRARARADARAGDEHPAARGAHGMPQRGAHLVVLAVQAPQRGAPVAGADRHQGAGR
ncbi:hypothetical protein [Quadrisphaera sp. KR29]|uniref:hypothetical protein n=1 Tax=Quadrisphaera sp. KR29 TaxID=3461391 RepID=UPI00404418D1